MREKIAQGLLIMYGAGLNDGQCGVEHPSIVLTDQLDKLIKELCEEIEKVENPFDGKLTLDPEYGAFEQCRKQILALFHK